ncbi:hypothetical protein D3C76_927490 [compost metagenome]
MEVPGAQLHSQLAETGGRGQHPPGRRAVAPDQHPAGSLRPGVPAGPSVRGCLHPQRRLRRGDHRFGGEVHHRHRVRHGLAPGHVQGQADRQACRDHRCGPGGPGLCRRAGARWRDPGGVRQEPGNRRSADLRYPRVQAGKDRAEQSSRSLHRHGHRVPPQHRGGQGRDHGATARRIRCRIHGHGHLHLHEGRFCR